MNYGYPGSSTHLENHNVSEEDFWPSFTDIMMVIVMVFLLVTVAVILNNWTLIADLKTSIQAQQLASTLADDRQEQNLTLEQKLSSLEKQLVALNEKYQAEKTTLKDTQKQLVNTEQSLTAKSTLLTGIEAEVKALNEKYEAQKLNLDATSQKLNTANQQLLTTKQQLTDSKLQLSGKEATIEGLDKKLIDLNQVIDKNKSSLLQTQAQLDERQKQLKDKEIAISALTTKFDKTLKEKQALTELSETQKAKIDESLKTQTALQAQLKTKEATLVGLQQSQDKNKEEITQLKQVAEEKTMIAKALQEDRGKLDQKLSAMQTSYESSQESLKSETSATKELQAQLKKLQQSLNAEQNADAKKDTEKQLLVTKLEQKAQEVTALEAKAATAEKRLAENAKTILALKDTQDSGNEQLRSLQGEYDTLDSKYQKLLQPARSSKGKFVVTVSYRKSGNRKKIRFKSSPDGSYKNVTNKELASSLEALKKKHKTDLYIKVIIPQKSGLSYNEAWKFTNNLQKKYDYYFQ
jgi:chromosome segregation ATPase